MAGGACANAVAAETTAAAASTEILSVFIAGSFPARTIDLKSQNPNPKSQIPRKSRLGFWTWDLDLGLGIWDLGFSRRGRLQAARLKSVVPAAVPAAVAIIRWRVVRIGRRQLAVD